MAQIKVDISTFKNKTTQDVFKYLCEMNARMLSLILNNTIYYGGIHYKTFSNKMEQLFTQIKLCGEDENLQLFKHSKKPNRFYLKSKVIEQSIRLFIEFDTNDKIKSITNPVNLKTRDDVINQGNFSLYFYDDEKLSFTPSDEYLITLNECNSAYIELNPYKNLVITAWNLKEWLYKYYDLYNLVKPQFNMGKFDAFYYLYFEMQTLIPALDARTIAIQAIAEFYSETNNGNHTSIEDWINRYRKIAFVDLTCIDFSFDKETASKIIGLRHCKNLYFWAKEVKPLFDFKDLYHTFFNNSQLSGWS